MSRFDKYWRKIPNKYGIILMAALIGYFLIMRLLGVGHEYWLRVFNAVILFFCIRGAIKAYKVRTSARFYEEFFDFFKIGMRTGFIGIAGFTAFVAIYLDVIDPVFMTEVRELETLSPYLTPVTAAGIIFIEGFGSSFICSYLAIQIMKRSTVEKPVKQDSNSKASVS